MNLLIISFTHFSHYLLEVQEDLKTLVIQLFPKDTEKKKDGKKKIKMFNL